jgi:hypothetical protein
MKKILFVSIFAFVVAVMLLPAVSSAQCTTGGFQKDQLCKFDGAQWTCRNLMKKMDATGLICDWSGYRFRCYDVDNLVGDDEMADLYEPPTGG